MSHLRLVVSGPPDPAEPVKKMARPSGVLQCNRCGSRTSVTLITGASLQNGRKQGGTIIAKDQCFHCLIRSIDSPMLPQVSVVK